MSEDHFTHWKDTKRIAELEPKVREAAAFAAEMRAQRDRAMARVQELEASLTSTIGTAKRHQARAEKAEALRKYESERVEKLKAEVERLKKHIHLMPPKPGQGNLCAYCGFLILGVNPSGDTLGRKERDDG